MDCISPPPIADTELLASLDGEAGVEVANHLSRCEYCRERAEDLRRFQNNLRARLYRADCPTAHELGEYHLGVLDRSRTQFVSAHVAECPHCARELAQLKEFLAAVEPEVEQSVGEQVRVLVAQLIGGTRGMQPAWAGLRGETERSIVYEADGIQIVLEIQDDPEQPDRNVLLGLVIGAGPADLNIQLWKADQMVAGLPVDEGGNFVISHLEAGTYRMILSGPQVEFHVQALEV